MLQCCLDFLTLIWFSGLGRIDFSPLGRLGIMRGFRFPGLSCLSINAVNAAFSALKSGGLTMSRAARLSLPEAPLQQDLKPSMDMRPDLRKTSHLPKGAASAAPPG